MQRRTVLQTLALAAGAPRAVCAADAPTVLNGWSIHPDDYPVNQAMQRFADELARITGQRLTAKVHGNGSLAPQGQVLERLTRGEIDFAEIGLLGYGDKVPVLQLLGTPFLFKESGAMFKLLDGRLGALIAAELRRFGVILLGWYEGGTRNFYHRHKPLRTASDFQGERLRVGNTPAHAAMVSTLGGKAVPLPFKEVLAAFEGGQIDGAENNLPSYESTGHYKVAPHYTLTRHLVSPEMLIMGEKAWARFSPAEQERLLQAGRESALHMRQLWAQRVAEVQARLARQGVQFHLAGDHGAVLRRMKPIYEPLWRSTDPVTREALSMVLTQGMAG
ncbi:TRAP transporter substrate-binding protein [Ideonella livida]|uniref:TRAP transporter substrate-binding protein n=1 Tax=Ideonella livida TaxID=2707176 RepID=A0A7C9PF13_9BURK|nr:TRAP transporter substrate-binding protein DctP [Ideonella livida]NDY90273.1 TRAP transporter substrate-binding protein [Ideonella livida]